MEAYAGETVVEKRSSLQAEQCWRAVVERDRRADGRFVYAVETTTIYCRPSCPSRRPLRKNVCFLASAAAAERKGYRACLRCLPQEALPPPDAVVARVRALLSADTEPAPTLAELGRAVSLSPSYLQRLFKQRTGISPKAYLAARRFQQLKRALRSEKGVSAAMYAAGYQAPSRAYETSRARLGMTPSAYRAGGAGERIAYAVAESSHGTVLVAATERGVCRVAFGASGRLLLAELRAEYPQAELVVAGGAAARWVRSVVLAVDAPWKAPSIPLDIHGTAFQLRVWKALQLIPVGETASYRAVAEAIAAPRAVRAVARACAANALAVLIPCHRVVRSDGSSGGYRWGPALKARLLKAERLRTGGSASESESRP